MHHGMPLALVLCWMSHGMSTSHVRSMSMIDPILGLSNRHRWALWMVHSLLDGGLLLRLLCGGCERLGFSFLLSALSFAVLIGWLTFVSIIGILEF